MRIPHSPGYRVYFPQTDKEIILLCGGDKSSREKDINRAKQMLPNSEGA